MDSVFIYSGLSLIVNESQEYKRFQKDKYFKQRYNNLYSQVVFRKIIEIEFEESFAKYKSISFFIALHCLPFLFHFKRCRPGIL